MKQTKDNAIVSLGIVSALGASMCCIGPVLAFVAGASGLATTFSWLEPARPVLIMLSVMVLGVAWYQVLKPGISCACEEEKIPFLRSKLFLGFVTVIVGLVLTFPYYAGVFYPDSRSSSATVSDTADIQHVEFEIGGMTCDGCARHISYSVTRIEGVIQADVSYEKEAAVVKFDASRTSIEKLTEVINSTGYTASSKIFGQL